MVVFPNCKINIGLRVIQKRPDGYHNISSVFLPVPWHDALEAIEAKQTTIQLSGLPVPGDISSNLCIKAWQLLKNDFPQLPSVQILLHKTIPTGAGLGGGSSNGAFTLKLLNEKFTLGLHAEQLANYALALGSDCPFFIYNTPCHATGRGEKIIPIALSLSQYYLVLINPGVHIATGWAFNQITPKLECLNIDQINWANPESWEKMGLTNDFEPPVVSSYPIIGACLQFLKKSGALYAAMTGTGSTCFGIFQNPPDTNHPYFAKMAVANIIKL